MKMKHILKYIFSFCLLFSMFLVQAQETPTTTVTKEIAQEKPKTETTKPDLQEVKQQTVSKNRSLWSSCWC